MLCVCLEQTCLVEEKFKDLKKKKRRRIIILLLNDNNKTQRLNYLVNKTRDIVFENRQRTLVDEQDQLNKLNIQIFAIESVRFLYFET